MAEKNKIILYQEKLSEAVGEYPILYDKNLPGFHLKEEKNVAWTRVARHVG